LIKKRTTVTCGPEIIVEINEKLEKRNLNFKGPILKGQ